jgi:tRNA (cytidine/uridine-2'-O-)-methyltransferase
LAARHANPTSIPAKRSDRFTTDLILNMLNIVLYQPEIPPNTGAVGRTCVAIGATLWLVRPLGFRIDDRTVRRAGLDYWQHLDCRIVDTWDDLCREIAGFQPWLFTRRADQCYLDVEFQSGDTLVFGAETTGLPNSIIDKFPGRGLRIPVSDQVRSLNLSNSVAVAAYEAVRQFRVRGVAIPFG